MNRRLLVALVSGATLVAATGALIAAQPRGAVFIAGDQPITEAQVREKLQSEGYSNIQILRQGNYFEAIGSKDGQPGKVVVDARTGRLADNDGDDDDD
jgi:CTP:molybdopterin cytidylyltransferase MocA